jgi:ABC-type phosphate transport system substrate-binding protein
MYNNESAVSVIVGTLALILVVVVGVVSVATILGNFSTDVSKQTGTTDSVAATKTKLNIAGSDNMDLLTRTLGASYAEENPSVRIISGVLVPDGVIDAVIKKNIDVGALSGRLNPDDLKNNPNIQAKQIGSSVVVLITNTKNPGVTNIADPIVYDDLRVFFQDSSHTGGNIKATGAVAVTHTVSSGTADTFYKKFLGLNTLNKIPNGGEALMSDQVLDYVASTEKAIAFADYGDVKTAISNGELNITILSIDDKYFPYYYANNLTYHNVTIASRYAYRSTARNADGSFVWTGNQSEVPQYNLSLIYPLYYVTKGSPNVAESGFLNYATSPSARSAFIQTNKFSIADF